MAGRAAERTHPLEPYVPRILAEWGLDAPGDKWQRVDGTLCFVDISGFTNLSEKLASRGRIGAEELTEVLDRVFGNMLRLAYDRGGSLLKFGGDALLLLFEGDDHAMQGTCAAVEMRAALREAVKIPTSVGKIRLRMSVGVHTGPIDLFRVGSSHHELIITGDTATKTTEMEATADPGEILISPELRSVLPKDAASEPKGNGWILRWNRPRSKAPGPVPRRTLDAATYDQCVPTQLRGYLRETHAEPEHRIATVGFVKFKGIGAAWVDGGPKAVADGLDGLVTTVQQAVD
ncbi:MAG: adenylate/guanylate cyclase domain-containing protein, partial [Acidimicrobiia bacterium]|nr:adenylate/guanylate cyclase domain-containing protein [Acidimicrobiia bacterium]